MEAKVVKLHKTSAESVIKELQEMNFIEIYVVGIAENDKQERTIHWYSSGNKSLLRAVGVLEYLKNRLLGDE